MAKYVLPNWVISNNRFILLNLKCSHWACYLFNKTCHSWSVCQEEKDVQKSDDESMKWSRLNEYQPISFLPAEHNGQAPQAPAVNFLLLCSQKMSSHTFQLFSQQHWIFTSTFGIIVILVLLYFNDYIRNIASFHPCRLFLSLGVSNNIQYGVVVLQ